MAQTTLTDVQHQQTQDQRQRLWSWRSHVRLLRRLAPLVTLLLLLLGWEWLVRAEVYPRFLVPAPIDVWQSFVTEWQAGTFLRHVSVTLSEMLLGLAIGLSSAIVLGYLIAKIRLLGEFLSPVIVAFQATPTIAYAPLLIIWFGSGMTSKVVICAVIVFFPTLMNTIVGIRNVPQNLRDLMRSLKATPLQTLIKLEIPAALPILLTGLKTSATLAVIGAVVGEFLGAQEGLGFLAMRARNQFDTPLMFVAVFAMTALALALYSLISLLEWWLLAWQRRTNR